MTEAEPAAGSLVVVEYTGSVAVITMSRPSHANSMDGDMSVALLGAIREATANGAGALVITGEGRAFSAGGDFDTIKAMQADRGMRTEILDVHRELFWQMIKLPIASVAAVNGPAVGAGLTAALLCDLVVLADDSFVSDPRVSLGLLDGAGGLILWPLLTSLSAARECLLLGDRLAASEAHRIGLVNRLAPRSKVVAEATELATRLADLPRHAVTAARRLINAPLEAAAAARLDACSAAETECFDSEEHRNRLDGLIRQVAAPRRATDRT